MAIKRHNLLGGITTNNTITKNANTKDTNTKKRGRPPKQKTDDITIDINKKVKTETKQQLATQKINKVKQKELEKSTQKTSTQTTQTTDKKRGRPPKILTQTTITPKNEPIKSLSQKKDSKTNIVSKETEWYNLTQQKPEEFRPIMFNTINKKVVTGYRMGNGFAVTIPYILNKFKKKFGYIEWQYIPHCSNLFKCPKQFPDCNNCKHSKKGL